MQSNTIAKNGGDFATKPAELNTFQYGPGRKAESTSNTFRLSADKKKATINDESLELLDETNQEMKRLDAGLGLTKTDSTEKVTFSIKTCSRK